MNMLKAGYARANITPMMGIDIAGYYNKRIADGVLDDLEVCVLALLCGEKETVFITVDHCGLSTSLADDFRAAVGEKTGLPKEAVFIHSTHTHTGPVTDKNAGDALQETYIRFLSHRIADTAAAAIRDAAPARMGWAIGEAKNVAFVRRFRMKDGSVKTNPGVDNPDIVAPIGDVDERVNVLRFDREGKETIVLANFGNHPDVVGGCKISGDWPTLFRNGLEKALDNTKCIFINGAQGDVNHVNVRPKGGDLNNMFMDFDDVSRGYTHAKHIANVVVGGVLSVYEKVKYEDVSSIRFAEHAFTVPSNMPTAEELCEAEKINALHNAGRDRELPYEGMMLTTVVAEAARMVNLKNGPEAFDMRLTGIAVGPVAFVGIPGEPFTGIGRGIKDTEGFDLICPACLTNGEKGYFPMQDAYDEGGYEARSSIFRAGVAEKIIAEGKVLLGMIKAKRMSFVMGIYFI